MKHQALIPAPHLRVLPPNTDEHTMPARAQLWPVLHMLGQFSCDFVAILFFRSRAAVDVLQLLGEAVHVCPGKQCPLSVGKTVVRVKWASRELGCGKPTYLLSFCGSFLTLLGLFLGK